MEVDLSALEHQPTEDTPAEEEEYDNIPIPDYEEPAPPEDKFGQERKRVLLLIEFHLNEFPKKLASYKKVKLENLTMDELKKLLEEMKFTIGAQSNVKMVVAGMCSAINLFEKLAVKSDLLKVQGLTQVVTSSENMIDDMKAIALKYMDVYHIEPEARLGFALMTTVGMLHFHNEEIEAKKQKTNAATTEQLDEVSNKYDDL
jgi:hypothetical protein